MKSILSNYSTDELMNELESRVKMNRRVSSSSEIIRSDKGVTKGLVNKSLLELIGYVKDYILSIDKEIKKNTEDRNRYEELMFEYQEEVEQGGILDEYTNEIIKFTPEKLEKAKNKLEKYEKLINLLDQKYDDVLNYYRREIENRLSSLYNLRSELKGVEDRNHEVLTDIYYRGDDIYDEVSKLIDDYYEELSKINNLI